jgi:cellulose biosynthesis protein BcsQ
MSRIHLIGGEKGGVGKSVVSRLLAQYHIDRALPFLVFDTDRSHGAMLRFYGDYTTPIKLDEFSGADRLMEAAVEAPRNVLVDLAAQTSQPLFRWIDDNDLLTWRRKRASASCSGM